MSKTAQLQALSGADIPANEHYVADMVDRCQALVMTRRSWMVVVLISLGGWFEIYDLFFTSYISPGLVREGILTQATATFFGFSGIGAFVAVTFAGLFIGTFFLGFLADKYGRRQIYTFSLLWYSAATLVMAFQTDASGLMLWRFIGAIGVGVQVVAMDAYIVEIVPKRVRGKAFALNHAVMFTAVPTVALLSWQLVPLEPFGFEGWRWVVLVGATGALAIWFIRKAVPESPLWLAQQGRRQEAEEALVDLNGGALAAAQQNPGGTRAETIGSGGEAVSLWRAPIRNIVIVLAIFHACHSFGYYGFTHWVPTLLVAKGITLTKSLYYSFLIAFAYPIGPLLAMKFIDRFERKWVIVTMGVCVGAVGLTFAHVTHPVLIIACGLLMTLTAMTMSYTFHAYQVEVFPTSVRARAGGVAYSVSRLTAMFSGFATAFALQHFGVAAVFFLISGAILLGVTTIAAFGPRVGGTGEAH